MERSAQHCLAFWSSWLVALLLFGFSVAKAAFVLARLVPGLERQESRHELLLLPALLISGMSATFVWAFAPAASRHSYYCTCLITLTWASCWSLLASYLPWGNHYLLPFSLQAWESISTLCKILQLGLMQLMIREGFMSSRGMLSAPLVGRFYLLCQRCSLVLATMALPQLFHFNSEEESFVICGSVFVWLAWLCYSAQILALIYILKAMGYYFGQAEKVAPPAIAAESQQARFMTFVVPVWHLMHLALSSCRLLFPPAFKGRLWPFAAWQSDPLLVLTLPAALDLIISTLLILAAGGVLTGMSHRKARALRHQRRRVRWQQRAGAWRAAKSGQQADEEKAWNRKVQDLAGRGLTLEALLRFYRGLGRDYMLHFDATRHSTCDVVNDAVLPLTSKDGCSLSQLMMCGGYTRPRTMVTHNWSNRFHHLVAAVLADALGNHDFSVVAWFLENDIDTLERWVIETGTGGETYWICAFSVNQHKSICGEDCGCGVEKALNFTPPLCQAGSIPCEMNKFDEMMTFLSCTDRNFTQVVAVDTRLELFSRAWCVAELSAACASGMKQRIQLFSMEGLRMNEERLRTLRIQDMKATREEDKVQILSSISDVDAFNSTLQVLLFEDLFPAWKNQDADDRFVSSSRLSYGQRAAGPRSKALWDSCVGVGDEDEVSSKADKAATPSKWALAS